MSAEKMEEKQIKMGGWKLSSSERSMETPLPFGEAPPAPTPL